MKIALVIDGFDPRRGGAERSLVQILAALQARGHQLHLVARDWAEPFPIPLTCHRVTVGRVPRWRRDARFARRSQALLASLAPDLVLGVRDTLAVDVFLARGGLYVETLAGNLRADPSWLNRWSYRLSPKVRVLLDLERQVFTRPNPPLVIAPSTLVQRHFAAHFGLPAERVPVIPTGVDLETFRPAPVEDRARLRRDLGITDRILVLFVAQNFKLKGLYSLLDAWRRVDHERFQLLVVGRDGRLSRTGLPPNVTLLGQRDEMLALYQAADLLVHPTFYDPFSRVVIEALACGLPVITTRYNGAAEIITDGQEGFLVDDPRDAALLAERIGRFGDAAARQRWSGAARTLAEQHPESQFLDATVTAIEAEGMRLRSAGSGS